MDVIMESLLNKKAGHFIGKHRNHEHIGKFRYTPMALRHLNIPEHIEILYEEGNDFNNTITAIGISELFEIIGRDNFIPEYDIICNRGVLTAQRATIPDSNAELFATDIFSSVIDIVDEKAGEVLSPEDAVSYTLVKKSGNMDTFSVGNKYTGIKIRNSLLDFTETLPDEIRVNVQFNSPSLIITSEKFQLVFIKEE